MIFAVIAIAFFILASRIADTPFGEVALTAAGVFCLVSSILVAPWGQVFT